MIIIISMKQVARFLGFIPKFCGIGRNYGWSKMELAQASEMMNLHRPLELSLTHAHKKDGYWTRLVKRRDAIWNGKGARQ